jgi:hypothetical protein
MLDRRFVYGCASTTIAPGLLLCALTWGPDLNSPFWKAHCFDRACPEERGREEKADRQTAEVVRRQQVRLAVARDLTDGRLTLLEAAARMRDLDRHVPGFYWAGFRRGLPGASDDERHCREAIGWVVAALPPDDPRGEGAVRRLKAELLQHLARGSLHLPEPEGGGAP